MSQFQLRNDQSPELENFVHIYEFAQRKNTSISLNSFPGDCSGHFRLYYILDGKFDWFINDKLYTLYPGDLALILPDQRLNAEKGYLEIGSLLWLHLQLPVPSQKNNFGLGTWSHISPQEMVSVRQILFTGSLPVLSRVPEAGLIFTALRNELFNQEIGYVTRVNQLLDEL